MFKTYKKFEVVFLGMERLAFAANKIYSVCITILSRVVELSYFRLCLHEQVDYDRECLNLCKCIGKGRSGQVGRVEESGDRL